MRLSSHGPCGKKNLPSYCVSGYLFRCHATFILHEQHRVTLGVKSCSTCTDRHRWRRLHTNRPDKCEATRAGVQQQASTWWAGPHSGAGHAPPDRPDLVKVSLGSNTHTHTESDMDKVSSALRLTVADVDSRFALQKWVKLNNPTQNEHARKCEPWMSQISIILCFFLTLGHQQVWPLTLASTNRHPRL